MQQKQQLEQKLWKIADTLRGKMSADDFRDYILAISLFDLKPHHLIEEDDESEYYDTGLLNNESLTLAFVTTAMPASGIWRWVL